MKLHPKPPRMMTFFAQPTFHAKKGGIDKAYPKKNTWNQQGNESSKAKKKWGASCLFFLGYSKG